MQWLHVYWSLTFYIQSKIDWKYVTWLFTTRIQNVKRTLCLCFGRSVNKLEPCEKVGILDVNVIGYEITVFLVKWMLGNHIASRRITYPALHFCTSVLDFLSCQILLNTCKTAVNHWKIWSQYFLSKCQTIRKKEHIIWLKCTSTHEL